MADGCRLISGHQKDLSMMQGVDDPDISVACFTGYHARAGTPKGVLAHTYIGPVNDVLINGVSVGEYGLNAAVAGDFGVPVTLVTGDDVTIEQVRSLLGQEVVDVQVKTGLAVSTADSIHPELAYEMIEAAARDAVGMADRIKRFKIENARIEASFNHQTLADMAGLGPDIEPIGERTVAFTAANGVALMTTWRSMLNRVMSRFAV